MSSDASEFGLAQINPLRYRGYYYDQETGLYYLKTRYYDPKVRRFLNADDASVLTKDPEQLTEKNLYAYCDDNPVMYRDDAGMFDIVSGIFGAVTNVATTYFAAKVTGQECGVGDLLIAATAGFVGGLLMNNFYATLANACISGAGTIFYSIWCGDDLRTALWKGGTTALCTAVSVNLFIGVKTDISGIADTVATTVFGVGNGLITAGAVGHYRIERQVTRKIIHKIKESQILCLKRIQRQKNNRRGLENILCLK